MILYKTVDKYKIANLKTFPWPWIYHPENLTENKRHAAI